MGMKSFTVIVLIYALYGLSDDEIKIIEGK
jgi:hypothetical protein